MPVLKVKKNGIWETVSAPTNIDYPVDSVNGKTGTVQLTHEDVGAVPTSRTINGKTLSSNISLNASDVGALPSNTEIPDSLSDLAEDSTHRTVTDVEKATWNAKVNVSDIPTKVSELENDKEYITSTNISVATVGQTLVVKAVDSNSKPTEWEVVDPWIMTSSTEGSNKKFKLTIDDEGVLTAAEIVEVT
jgi:hypothetical protein